MPSNDRSTQWNCDKRTTTNSIDISAPQHDIRQLQTNQALAMHRTYASDESDGIV
jgi:hypothetical protein